MAQIGSNVSSTVGDGNGQFQGSASGQHVNPARNAEVIQGSRSTPYESASAVNYQASHIYPNSVVPYGSSSLSGANVLPPTQVIYPPSQSQSRSQPGTPSTSPAAAGKRKETEDGSHNPAPRKRRPPSLPNGDDPDVGPNGGPKHWTDSEKTSLFNWLLLHDNHWDMFRTKMNTVFRDASAQIFGGRKSFTALKSCYHRNVETFKQIFAFEVYLSRLPPDPNNPADGNAPFSDRIHDPTMARQAYLEQKLEEARGAGVPVANLNMKVIDHWHQKGWYNLFKSRFREDPRTGLPIPSYGPSSLSFPAEGSSNQMLYPPSAIDPQLTNSNADEEEEEEEEDVEQQVQETLMSPMHNNHPGPSTSAAQSDSQIPPNPTGRDAPLPPTPILPQKASQPHSSTRRTVAPSLAPDLRTEQMHLQMMQAMDRFTAVTNSLMDQCATLSQLLVAEAEERKIRAQAQSERVGKKEDGLNRKEKATLATEMLANADVGDECVQRPCSTPSRSEERQEDRPALSAALPLRVRIVGYDQFATTAIKAANQNGGDYLEVPWSHFDSIMLVMKRIEDKVCIPVMYWRLASNGIVLEPNTRMSEQSLFVNSSSGVVELTLVPINALKGYIAQTQQKHEWKVLTPATTTSSDPRARAPPAWSVYIHQRTHAVKILRRALDEHAGIPLDPLLVQIRAGIEAALETTGLSPTEQSAVADGVVPLYVNLEDDMDMCVLHGDAEILTRIYSPSTPAAIDMHLSYHRASSMFRTEYDFNVIYRIHSELSRPKAGRNGWRAMFSLGWKD
ncbi:uncharacterized protein LAESUDRAFT_742775 [Laetiporus sulphureus 93-53]|uniref:Uncharacterized protein n=1 Tax=Laetiporus sulphureus 93-53 TaxID=1314785 RepID=A0A165ESA9_9APHY|nr:uncharacterized protein LAESUDRAFT_742775 [Laetiporus sulphureus 93-53]KZT07661.1 hypothetical protein LAESUDRAFT_742775 [Laetiporus sulphureus 93-53]